jgi:hypothetical protein
MCVVLFLTTNNGVYVSRIVLNKNNGVYVSRIVLNNK